MEALVRRLQHDFPHFAFKPGQAHCWSPEQNQILYTNKPDGHNTEGLLHELGHARLGHKAFTRDLELLSKEVAAWQEALALAKRYEVQLDQDHIQDCLDTYRDWVYKRSTCPACKSTGAQQTETQYYCINCSHRWRVTASRSHRPYRRSTGL